VKRDNKNTFINLQSDVKGFSKKMTDYRERLIKIKRGDDPDAIAVATRLLEASPAGIGTLELYSKLFNTTCRGAMARFK